MSIWIEIVNRRLNIYKEELLELTDSIADNTHDQYSNGMMRRDSIDKRMAVIKAKIGVCETLLKELDASC